MWSLSVAGTGLVTAFYVAKAGFKPLVLERSGQVGGRYHQRIPSGSVVDLAHTAGPIRPDISATCNWRNTGCA